MKYWDCINVPGMTNAEDAKTSAPSADDHAVEIGTVLDVGGTSLSVTETLKGDVTASTVSDSATVSPEYVAMLHNAIGKSDVRVEPVAGTDGYSVSVTVPDNPSGLIINENPVPITTDAVYVRTPEEADAAKYMTADEVDYSAYENNTVDFEDVPEFNPDEDNPIVDDETPAEEEKKEESINKADLLAGIYGNGAVDVETLAETIAEKAADKVVEKAVEAAEPPEPVYTLEPDQLEKVIETLNEYEEKYFKEIPIAHLSNRFLRNITKDVYRAHQDAVEKYEAPALMDPIFLLYPLTCDDPYMAMGKFWDIVMTKILDDSEWQNAVEHSVKEYDEYMEQLAEDEDEDGEETEDVADESENNNIKE